MWFKEVKHFLKRFQKSIAGFEILLAPANAAHETRTARVRGSQLHAVEVADGGLQVKLGLEVNKRAV